MSKQEQTTGSLVLITIAYIVLGLLVFCGCSSAEVKSKAVFETSVPDVWAEEPSQNLTIRIEVMK